MIENTKKYFLAANSCEGFVSYFGESYKAEKGWRCYIIKGGAGTGKSSFMKALSNEAKNKNIEYILCPCSSDPNSLDAVIFPTIKTVIMDGTPPHIVEPIYAGACEEIINLGDFWNSNTLKKSLPEIITATNQNKALHRSAARFFASAGEFMRDSYYLSLSLIDAKKATSTADKLFKKYVPNKKGECCEWVRFLSGVTPNGYVSFFGDVLSQYKKSVIFSDNEAAASTIILQKIRKQLLDTGYEIITVKNSFLPSLIIDAIIIPELSLYFARESAFEKLPSSSRRIHSKRFLKQTLSCEISRRLKINKKLFLETINSGCFLLSEAKSVHDKLEKLYIPNMDFKKVDILCEMLKEGLFKT